LAEYSPDAIAAAMVDNHWQFYNIYARQPEVEAHEQVGLAWISSAIPVTYLNQIMYTRLADEEVEAQIVAMLDHYRSRDKTQFVWRTWPDTCPEDLGERLLAHGFTARHIVPNMAADLQQLADDWPPPAGLTIARIGDAASLTFWAEVVRIVYDTSDDFARFLTHAFSVEVGDPATAARHYLAWLDGQAVACATLFLGAGVAGIYRVATLPGVRGQGIGGAVVITALREARAAGYRFATLRSSEIAHHLYQRLGFRDEFYTLSYLCAT
jgi:GNAT superfamily N-acetyltransferase